MSTDDLLFIVQCKPRQTDRVVHKLSKHWPLNKFSGTASGLIFVRNSNAAISAVQEMRRRAVSEAKNCEVEDSCPSHLNPESDA